MSIQETIPISPFAPTDAASRQVNVSGSNDWYGACSIEDFIGDGDLGQTHEDAQGWLEYPTGFNAANFWFKDSGVKVWIYEEAYDNWQDTYGADAVVAFYHSGHGAMDNNGVFILPTGGVWDGRSTTFSNRMSLGNEQVRYLFWSTCLSLRVLEGHSPIRTWHNSNLGFRMIFGFETVSIDHPNYGKNFWNHWKQNKAFSKAWLDASWDIHHGQAPSVCACGANQAEARNRLNTERFFNTAGVSKNWYEWIWYNARSMNQAATTNDFFNNPSQPLIAEMAPVSDLQRRALRFSEALEVGSASTIVRQTDGNYFAKNGEANLMMLPNGRFNAMINKTNVENTTQIDLKLAQSLAESFVAERELAENVDLNLANVRYSNSAGGSTKGSGTLNDPKVIETTFEFRQKINGLQAIHPETGVIRVSVDNDGKITNVYHALRPVDNLSSKSRTSAPTPPEPGSPIATPSMAMDNLSLENLDAAFETQLRSMYNRQGKAIRGTSVELISDEVGYDLSGNYGRMVAKRVYELEFKDGFKKRYMLEQPIFA